MTARIRSTIANYMMTEQTIQKKKFVLLRSELQSWWIDRVMKPMENFCVKQKISPNFITLVGLGVSVICFVLYARGKFLTAGWLVLLNGSIDILDGRVARATNRVSRKGEYL